MGARRASPCRRCAAPADGVGFGTRDPQLEQWRHPLSGPTGGAGNALRLADLPADRTTREAKLGLLAATQSPTAAADLALAVAHRPILRFDRHEPVPRPLDVDALFRTGLISMCEGGQTLRCECGYTSAHAP